MDQGGWDDGLPPTKLTHRWFTGFDPAWSVLDRCSSKCQIHAVAQGELCASQLEFRKREVGNTGGGQVGSRKEKNWKRFSFYCKAQGPRIHEIDYEESRTFTIVDQQNI